jgi:MFS family permease
MFGAFSGFLFLNALYLQEVRHLTPFATGVYTLPLAIATIACSPISGRLVGAYGTRPSLVGAGTAIAVSGLMLAQVSETTSLAWLVAAYIVFGIGFGLVNTPITNTAVSGMPRAQAGLAAAVASTSRQVGASLGVAISGTIAAARASGVTFVGATRTFWWLVVAGGTTVVALGLLSNGAWARRTLARTASLLDDAPQGVA